MNTDSIKKFDMDQNVGFANFYNSAMSPNLDVGRVINIFSVFTSAIVAAKAWKMKKSVAKNQKHCEDIFNTAFPGAHNVPGYLPLPLGVEEDGNMHQYVTDSVIKAKMAEMAAMAITPENVFAAAMDLQAIVRLYAESTIDAAKTGLDVIIENLENLKKLKRASKDELEVMVDWNNDTADIRRTKQFVSKGGKVVNDCFDAIRCDGMNEVLHLASYLAKEKQQFPGDILMRIEQAGNDPRNAGLVEAVRLVKEMYLSLSQLYNREMNAVRAITNDKEIIAQHKKALKPTYDAQYDGLRNMLRVAMHGMSAVDRMMIALYVTYTEKGLKNGRKGASSDVSDFSQILLPEEFFLFALDLYKDDDRVPKYTEDSLEKVEGIVAEGEVVDFVFGEAEGTAIVDGKEEVLFSAVAKDPRLEGEFMVRKNREGRWVASRKLTDIIQVPEGDDSKLTFVTKIGEQDIKLLNQNFHMLKRGTEVSLVAYDKAHNLHDAVILNGKQVMRFRSEAGKNNAYVTKLFNLKKGKVASVVSGVMSQPLMGKDGKAIRDKDGKPLYAQKLAAIVTLEGVHKVSLSEALAVDPNFVWEEKPVKKNAKKVAPKVKVDPSKFGDIIIDAPAKKPASIKKKMKKATPKMSADASKFGEILF